MSDKYFSYKKELQKLQETIIHCMQQAAKEDPDSSKDWTPEEGFEKGALWAGRNIRIVVRKEE